MEMEIEKRRKQAAIYARVSTDTQVDNTSLDQQIQSCRRSIELDANYVLNEKHIYREEGISGKNTVDRVQFQRMIAAAMSGEIDRIVTWKVDRFTRSMKDLLVIVDQLKPLGVDIMFSGDGGWTTSDARLGSVLLGLLGGIAESERANIIERMTLGKRRTVANGIYLTSRSNFGYIYDREATGKIRIDPEQAEVVKRLYREYLREGSSTIKVAEILNQAGYKTKFGRPWTPEGVNHILSMEIYRGEWKYLDLTVNVPALVSVEDWNRAQDLLKQRCKYESYSKRKTREDYLCASLARCGQCGSKISGRFQPYESNGQTFIRTYYSCSGRHNRKRPSFKGCSLRWIQAEKVDDVVWNEVVNILHNPEIIETAVKARVKDLHKILEPIRDEIKGLQTKLEKLARHAEKYEEAYLAGVFGVKDFNQRMEALKLEKEPLESHLKQLQERLENEENSTSNPTAVSSLIDQLKTKIKGADFAQKQRIVRLLIERIVIHSDATIDIHFSIPEIQPSKPTNIQELKSGALGGYDKTSSKPSIIKPRQTSLRFTVKRHAILRVVRHKLKPREDIVYPEYCNVSQSQLERLNRLAEDEFEGNRSAVMRACIEHLVSVESQLIQPAYFNHSPVSLLINQGVAMVRITTTIPGALANRLREVSQRTGLGKMELLRIALDEYKK